MVDLEFSLVATELWKILRLIGDFGSWLGNSVYSLRRCRERGFDSGRINGEEVKNGAFFNGEVNFDYGSSKKQRG